MTSCASQLTAPLTRIYNRGINEACFPGVWKLAKVVALYKKKSHFLPENYRPISLLNCFGIFFRKINIQTNGVIYRKIQNTLYLSIWFSEKAFYFTRTDRHSGQNKDALDKNEYVLGIFLDITKAFDSVKNLTYCSNIGDTPIEDKVGVIKRLVKSSNKITYDLIPAIRWR